MFLSRFSSVLHGLTVPCWFQSLEFDLVSFGYIHGLRRGCLIFACCWSITISSTSHSIFSHYFLFIHADCCLFKLTVKNCIVYTLWATFLSLNFAIFLLCCLLIRSMLQATWSFVCLDGIVTNTQIFIIDFSIWLATLLIECCLNCVNHFFVSLRKVSMKCKKNEFLMKHRQAIDRSQLNILWEHGHSVSLNHTKRLTQSETD